MTISIPPEDMVPQGRYTAEQKEKVVLEYYSVKHGQRRKYLDSIGVSYSSFKRWRKQFAGGDLVTGLTPRHNIPVCPENINEYKRLRKSNEALSDEIARLKQQLAEKDEIIARKAEQTEAHCRAVDAMGKAIAIMQKYSED
ncbi:transposase [Corynebacterium guaraldiae]